MRFRLWHKVRTALDLADRVLELEEQFEQISLEWVDKKDAFEGLLKRLAVRDARRRPEPEPVDGDPSAAAIAQPAAGLDKQGLREYARAKGFLR